MATLHLADTGLDTRSNMSDVNAVIVQPLKQFVKDSVHLVKKCTKPDRKEFTRIAWATGVGFLIMGAPPGKVYNRMKGVARKMNQANRF